MRPGQAPVLIPVTAEDVRRRKIRLWTGILTGAAVLLVAAFLLWNHWTDPIAAREAFDAGARNLRTARYSEAVLSLGRAVSLQPRFAEAYLLRGRAYLGLNDTDHAIADFSKTIELNPTDLGAYYALANVRFTRGDFRDVVAACDHIVTLQPNAAKAYNLRGSAYQKLGQLDQALGDLSRAVQLAPNVDNLYERGDIYRKLGENQLAVADFTRAIGLEPDVPHLYYARAACLVAMGDVAGARRDHQRARFLDSR